MADPYSSPQSPTPARPDKEQVRKHTPRFKQPSTPTSKQAGRQTDRQAGRHTGGEASRYTDRQTDIIQMSVCQSVCLSVSVSCLHLCLSVCWHHELGFRQYVAEIVPTGLPELPSQLRDLRNNKRSLNTYLYFIFPVYSLHIPLYSFERDFIVPI